MPTLANIQGGSLVADISGPLKQLDAFSARKRKDQAQQEALDALRVAGGLPTPPVADEGGGGLLGSLRSLLGGQGGAAAQPVAQPGGDRGNTQLDNALRLALEGRAPPPAKSKDANLLGQVNPAVAKQAAEVAGRAGEVESAEFRDAATKGMSLAKEVQDIPDFAGQRRRLAKLAADAARDGTPEDQQRILQLMNLDEANLGLELTKMQVTGRGMLAAVPEIKPTGPFKLFKTPEQRDALAQLMITNPAAAATMITNRRKNLEEERIAAAPQSELAQALARVDTDEARGDLTPATANARRRSLRLEATKAGRAEDLRIAAARAAAVAPKTDLAQTLNDIAADLAAGRLTPEVAAQMTENARAGAVQADPVPFSGAVPKGFMLVDPADPRKGVIPIPGAPVGDGDGGVTTAARTAEAKIQRIMDTQDVDRTTASGIVDGVLRVTRDPVTGDAIITNLATGESFLPSVSEFTPEAPAAAGVRAAPAGAVPAPEDVLSSNPEDIGAITAAMGAQGLVVRALNTLADAFSLPLPGPETDKAIVTLNSLNVRTMLGLAAEFPGRPSNLTRERIESLLAKPASFVQGSDRALAKLRNVRNIIVQSLQTAESVSSGTVISPTGRRTRRKFTPTQVGEANAAVLALTPLLEEYDTVLRQIEGQSGGAGSGTTASGVQWSIQP